MNISNLISISKMFKDDLAINYLEQIRSLFTQEGEPICSYKLISPNGKKWNIHLSKEDIIIIKNLINNNTNECIKLLEDLLPVKDRVVTAYPNGFIRYSN